MIKDFYVVAPVINPMRFKSRANLYHKFVKHMHDSGAQLYTIEVAFGDRPFELTHHADAHHLQLRTIDELWHKENMINQVVERLPKDWKYVAWIDADIEFTRKDWVTETVHQLQHYEVVQMWQHAIDMGPNNEFVQQHTSFMHQYVTGAPYKYGNIYGPSGFPHWHSGFAWACTRDAWDKTGGLLDFAILGAGDNHMAHGLIGYMEKSFHPKLGKAYANELMIWQERAIRHIKKDVGYVPGTILHNWHGKKKDRKYWDRWQILIKNQYNPRTDIKRDWQGLYQLETGDDRQIKLRDDIRAYFRTRNEDSIDLA